MTAMWAWHAHELKYKCLYDAQQIFENNYLRTFNELLIYLLLSLYLKFMKSYVFVFKGK